MSFTVVSYAVVSFAVVSFALRPLIANGHSSWRSAVRSGGVVAAMLVTSGSVVTNKVSSSLQRSSPAG